MSLEVSRFCVILDIEFVLVENGCLILVLLRKYLKDYAKSQLDSGWNLYSRHKVRGILLSGFFEWIYVLTHTVCFSKLLRFVL